MSDMNMSIMSPARYYDMQKSGNLSKYEELLGFGKAVSLCALAVSVRANPAQASEVIQALAIHQLREEPTTLSELTDRIGLSVGLAFLQLDAKLNPVRTSDFLLSLAADQLSSKPRIKIHL